MGCRLRMRERRIGAESGNRPTGPFVPTAATTHKPETEDHVRDASSVSARPDAIAANTAAVVKSETVVSSMLPTIDHETTGTRIQNATGSQSCSCPPDSLAVTRQIAAISRAVIAPAVSEYARSTIRRWPSPRNQNA